MGKTRLSIFVDESGILNEPANRSRYYVLALLLHDQSLDIETYVKDFDQSLQTIGIANLCFHASPIIRANQQFEFMNWDLRRKIFSRMMSFSRQLPIVYHCLTVDKKFCDTVELILSLLDRQLSEFVASRHESLRTFDDVKVYYDCGQKQITQFLHHFFERLPTIPVEFAQAVEPRRYRLFQVADLVCTLKLLELKLKTEKRLAPSERSFFGGEKKFTHDILRAIKAKEI